MNKGLWEWSRHHASGGHCTHATGGYAATPLVCPTLQRVRGTGVVQCITVTLQRSFRNSLAAPSVNFHTQKLRQYTGTRQGVPTGRHGAGGRLAPAHQGGGTSWGAWLWRPVGGCWWYSQGNRWCTKHRGCKCIPSSQQSQSGHAPHTFPNHALGAVSAPIRSEGRPWLAARRVMTVFTRRSGTQNRRIFRAKLPK